VLFFVVVPLIWSFSAVGPSAGRRRARRAATSSDYLLDAAVSAAREAGALIVSASPEDRVSSETKATAKNLLTKVDVACQDIIVKTLLSMVPESRILGEENVAPGAAASALAAKEAMDKDGLVWVIDPIDGTANFVDGIPLSTVSIACVLRDEVLVGVVYDPFRDELFQAAKGQGATLNGKTLQVSKITKLDDAIIYAGCPPTNASLKPSLRGICAVAPKSRTMRLLGSAALMLAYVAAGRGAAYFEADLSAWDTAAGACLIKEAGGQITDADNQTYRPSTTRQILATNGHIHNDLFAILDEVNGIRLDN